MEQPRPRVVSRAEWLVERTALLAKEKALTRQRDALSAERRALPMVKVDKTYLFETRDGPKRLDELFDGRSQLIVHHFMLGPGWKEGCVGCSFASDHIDGTLPHLRQHDIAFVRVSRAPLAEIEAFNARMGWQVRWVSSHGSDFNHDYHVSFTPEELASGTIEYNYAPAEAASEELSGVSVFSKNADGELFHTYSCYGRGDEGVLGTYFYADLTPKGRNEHGPRFNLTDWARHHDRYDQGGTVDATGRYRASSAPAATDAAASPCCHSDAAS